MTLLAKILAIRGIASIIITLMVAAVVWILFVAPMMSNYECHGSAFICNCELHK